MKIKKPTLLCEYYLNFAVLISKKALKADSRFIFFVEHSFDKKLKLVLAVGVRVKS